MKRKDLDEISSNSYFSDISLACPSTKLRRLDDDIYMTMEAEKNSRASLVYEQLAFPIEEPLTSTGVDRVVHSETPLDLSKPLHSDDRALVLYNPANTPFLKSPSSSDFSIVLNSDLIPGLKNLVFWPGNLNSVKRTEDEAAEQNMVKNDYLAVVPWVASGLRLPSVVETPMTGQSEQMEAEGGEAEMMETEEITVANSGREAFEFGGMVGGGEGLQQWQQQQQHCMAPQLFQNATTPVTWQQIGTN